MKLQGQGWWESEEHPNTTIKVNHSWQGRGLRDKRAKDVSEEQWEACT